jgi:predicted dehydrogenase
MPLRFGLIGVGGVGGYHLKTIQDLEAEGLTQLVAVADPTIGRFPELAADLAARGVRQHLDYRAMLDAESGALDIVTIATPIPFHLEMTLACLERGLFVNLEKPPVPLIQQLETLIAADTEYRVGVGFQWINARCVQEAKRMVVEGRLGAVREVRASGCWPRRDSYYNRAAWSGKMTLRGEPVFDGPATNAFGHLLHNIMFLASPEASGFEVPAEIQGELYRARPTIESYDTVCLRGRLGSGVKIAAAFTHAAKEMLPFQIEVRGDKGWARISQDGARFESSDGEQIDCPESTHELLNKSYRELAQWTSGERARIGTRLVDTRGYVLTTNGLLLSSGGIHAIDPQQIESYKENGEDEGFDVQGLRQAIETVFAEGRLFSEQGLPWARPTTPVSVENLKSIDFSKA